MKSLILSAIVLILLSGNAFANSGSNVEGLAPANFFDIQDFNNTKTYGFDCDFSKVLKSGEKARPYCVRLCQDNTSCKGMNADNYVSYFIPFNYQYIPVAAYDYAINAFRYMEKDNVTNSKNMLGKILANKPAASGVTVSDFAANLSFPNFVPYSFALKGDEKGVYHIFISAKDILLRNGIYPSLKLLALKKPTKTSDENSLSKYSVEYSIYPSAFEVPYSDDWTSYFLGIPLYEKAKYNVGSVVKYFEEAALGAKSIDFKASDSPTGAEKARPFDFSLRLKAMQADKNVILAPAIGDKSEGFANEQLPPYSLEKIEIVKKTPTGEEFVIQAYNKEAVEALIAKADETDGFLFSGIKNDNETISIRFKHAAQTPAYVDLSVGRALKTGIRDIYGLLGTFLVSDLNISKYYDFKDVPRDCLTQTGAAALLDEQGVKAYDIKAFTESFKDTASVCDTREKVMTKIIITNKIR